jgi:hypothetical protein
MKSEISSRGVGIRGVGVSDTCVDGCNFLSKAGGII